MFQQIVHLRAYHGLPLSKTLYFEEPDPVSPVLHTRPLTIAGRTLSAVLMARPKSKAYELEILKDPPMPGIYEFLLLYMGVEYPIEIELLPGEGGKELQTKLMDAIKKAIAEAKMGGVLSICAPSCANAYEIIIAGLWPGVDFELSLVSQPVPDPPEDQVDLDILQDNIPIAEFVVDTAIVDGKLALTVKLSTKQTGGLPATGDGPYMWKLIASSDLDPENDVLLLARGHLVVERA